jgi:hypothetical protein
MATNGKTTSDKDLAIRLANAEAGSGGGKSVSDADLQRALQRVTGSPTDTAQQKEARRNMVLRMISELESAGAAGKTGQFTGRRMQYGGKMKKKYQSKGKVTSDKDADIKLAWRYAKAEAGSGGKEASEQDFYQALKRVKSSPEMVRKRLNELQAMGAAGKSAQPTNTGAVGKLQRLQQGLGMQYGGMADMSAAPMIKQPQRKKRKASGFRTKYSKGGGVRASKYKL